MGADGSAAVRPAPPFLIARPHVATLAVAAAGFSLLGGALVIVKPDLAVALVGGAALIAAVLCKPYYGGIVLVAVVPATSGLAPGSPLPNLRLSELLIGSVSLCLLASTRRRDRLSFDGLEWLLLVYGLLWALFGVLGARSGGTQLSLPLWGTVFGQLQFFLLYRGVRLSLRTPHERRRGFESLVVAATVVSLLAIAQEVRIPQVESLLSHLTGGIQGGAAGSLLRASGPFDNWAALAGFLLPVIFVMAALALSGSSLVRSRTMAVAMAAMTIALLTTLELSAIACLLVAMIWLGFRYRKGRRTLAQVGGAMAVGALATSPLLLERIGSELAPTAGVLRDPLIPQTIAFRVNVWGQYWRAIPSHLAGGYGVVLPSSIAWPFPESQYVALLIEGGVPMLLSFAALNVAVIVLCRRAGTAESPFDAALGRGLLAVAVSLLALDVIWPYFSNGGFPQVFWALLALAAPAWQHERHRGAVVVPRGSALHWRPS